MSHDHHHDHHHDNELDPMAARVRALETILTEKGLVEICRTGVAAMNRGPQGM